MALQCSNPECRAGLAQGVKFCGHCGSPGQEKQQAAAGVQTGDIGYLDGNISNTQSGASISAINLNLGGQLQPHSQVMVRCPLCGRRNEENNTFKCRECKTDHYCQEHLDKEHFVCLLCARKQESAQTQVQQESVEVVLCPLCGRRNELSATFQCQACGRDHLCAEHQDPAEYICTACVQEKQRSLKQEQQQALAQWQSLEQGVDVDLGQGNISGAELHLTELEALTIAWPTLFDSAKLDQVRTTLEQKKSGPLPGQNFTEPETGMEMIWVPGGEFSMGDTFGDGEDHEKPVHQVVLDGFWIGKYPVTQGQYQRITGQNPAHFQKGDGYPVEQVSWEDTQDFIRQLRAESGKDFRLPTEAEWEYAARSGGRQERYAGGDDLDNLGWHFENNGGFDGSTQPVGRKAANGLGLYDMSGNVCEWCWDWHAEDYYSSSPRANPTGPSSGSNRVFRGGGWRYNPRGVRAANRSRLGPGNRDNLLGFRLVFPVQ